MCTVTIVPLIEGEPEGGDGKRSATTRHSFRLACNRDELRTRAIARPPEMRRVGGRNVIMPIDPDSDGTWVAVNDVGVVMTLLNVNRGSRLKTFDRDNENPAASHKTVKTPPPQPFHQDGVGELGSTLCPSSSKRHSLQRSRGEIIPTLIGAGCADEAGESSCAKLGAGAFRPFRLIIVDERAVWDVLNDGQKTTAKRSGAVRRAVMFTSSGLGDQLVEPPRRALFEEMFTEPTAWAREQDAYHRHRWPKRTRVSVCMSRDDARTVSHSVVEVLPHRVRMIYYPDSPDLKLEPTTLEMDRTTIPP